MGDISRDDKNFNNADKKFITRYHNSSYPFWSSFDNLVCFLPLLKKSLYHNL